jgi:DNA-binding NarL/FixJ family response regulator
VTTSDVAACGRCHGGTVLIVDDHGLIAQGLAFALRAQGLEAVMTSDPSETAVMELVRAHRPVLALVDLQFGGTDTEGLALVAPITAAGTRVVVLTGVTDRAVLGRCLEAGATGIASKAEPFDRLLERIDAAIDGRHVMSLAEIEDLRDALYEHRADLARRMAPLRSLSPRECEVLDGLMRGQAADAIAAAAYVSVATVRTHIQAILRKLEVNSQLAAVARARECGWSLHAAAAPAPATV